MHTADQEQAAQKDFEKLVHARLYSRWDSIARFANVAPTTKLNSPILRSYLAIKVSLGKVYARSGSSFHFLARLPPAFPKMWFAEAGPLKQRVSCVCSLRHASGQLHLPEVTHFRRGKV